MYEKLVSYAAKQLELSAEEITPDSTFESLGIDDYGPGVRVGC